MHTTTMHSCFFFNYVHVSDKQKDLKIRYILFYITHSQCPKAWTLDQGNMHLIIKVDSLKKHHIHAFRFSQTYMGVKKVANGKIINL